MYERETERKEMEKGRQAEKCLIFRLPGAPSVLARKAERSQFADGQKVSVLLMSPGFLGSACRIAADMKKELVSYCFSFTMNGDGFRKIVFFCNLLFKGIILKLYKMPWSTFPV